MKKKILTKPFLVRFDPVGFEKVKTDAWTRKMTMAEHIRDLVGRYKTKGNTNEN